MHDRHWQHFPHEADIGVRGFGDTIEQAFEQAALAMIGAITDPERVEPLEEITIGCQAPDPEQLLVDWLNAIVYEIATRKLLFGKFDCKIDNNTLTGSAWGEPIDVSKHEPAVEVKGATQTHLRVAERPNGAWVAECVIDV